MEKRKPEPEEGIQSESGATAGRTHAEVLEQTLGLERAHEILSAGGPPAVPDQRPRKKS